MTPPLFIRVTVLQNQNPKFEARNPKQTKHSNPKSKSEIQESKSEMSWFEIFYFLIIGICFEFRISSFEFFLISHSRRAFVRFTTWMRSVLPVDAMPATPLHRRFLADS